MKSYPSIEYASECRLPIVAFDKLDGSNVRAEWTWKRGFHKFGTRNKLIDSSDQLFAKVPSLIEAKYGQQLGRALYHLGHQRAVCFFEFWGPGSFAGQHDLASQHTVTLFDVAPFNRGIMPPDEFLSLVTDVVGPMDHARELYRGPVTQEFIEQVRSSTLPGMTFEGVVCKSANDRKTKMPIMFKQKSRVWLDRLKERCAGNEEMLRRLM